ncbi:MAG: alpha/beta hydrolase [Planctomycetota bacterium]
MRPILLALLALTAACVAPVVQSAGTVGPDLLGPDGGAIPVETVTEDGVTLRGGFVDAGPGAPVVLHLLPSAASTSTGVPAGIGRVGLSGTLATLRALGWSSLVLDYRGVGRSDGSRDARRLPADGRAMWAEAVRRAGGAPDRVVLRATSLGTLVAAELLATEGAGQGAPRAAALAAPVRAATVVRNGARERHGAVAAWWAGLLHSAPNVPELEDVVASERVPLLLVLSENDGYLPPAETERVRRAALEAGHEAVVLDGDHARTVLRTWGMDVDQAGFSGRRTPELLDAERRFLAWVAPPAPE